VYVFWIDIVGGPYSGCRDTDDESLHSCPVDDELSRCVHVVPLAGQSESFISHDRVDRIDRCQRDIACKSWLYSRH